MDASRALILICLSLLLGISIGTFGIIQLLFVFILIGTAALFTMKQRATAVGVIAGLVLGFLLGSSALNKINYYNSLDSRNIEVETYVIEGLHAENAKRYSVGGNRFKYELVTDKELGLGQPIKISGTLTKDDEPWDRYDYSRGELGTFLFPKIQTIDVPAVKETVFNKLRNSIEKTYVGNLSPDAAGLASGLFLGEKSELSKNLKDSLIKTGTIHIVVLSGYNITIIIALFTKLFSFIRIRLRMLITILGIFAFLMLVGFSPSVVRAAIMGGVLVLEPLVGRKRNQVAVLVATATIMSLASPLSLTSDPGFQLSFLATLGLILFQPRFENLFMKVPKILRDSLSTSLSAQVLALPALAFYFGSFSILSPLVNMVVLPFIPLAMFVSALLPLFVLVPWTVEIFANIAEAVLLVPIKLIEFGSAYSPQIAITTTGALLISVAAMFILSPKKLQSEKNET